jgi:hypothetical protein
VEAELTGTAPSPLPQSYVYVLDAGLKLPPSAFAEMAAGHQAQMREDVAPAWGVGNGDSFSPSPAVGAFVVPENIVPIYVHAVTPASASAGAEAEHGDDVDGHPLIHVYEDMLVQYGIGPETPTLADAMSAAISHEIIEQRVDPECDRSATLPDGRVVAIEACDQVQAQTYLRNGIRVSNFNTPSNFDGGAAPYDFLGNQSTRFQTMPGGYSQTLTADGWQVATAIEGFRDRPRALVDSVPCGMLRYRLELAFRDLGRAARRRA